MKIDLDKYPQYRYFPKSEYNKVLNEQFDRMVQKVEDSWQKCKTTAPAPYQEAIDILVYLQSDLSAQRSVSKAGKCNIDCTLRETGVVSELTMTQ